MAISTSALLGGAALAGGLSLVGSGLSSWFGKKSNDSNLKFQRENLEYNKALQQQIFEREDTAYQRAAADAQKIGINPMALSSPASAGSVVPTTAPYSENPFANMDFTGAIGNALGAINGMNAVMSGSSQRDLLRSQVDSQNLQNSINAVENGFYKDSNGDWAYNPEFVTRPKSRQQDIDYQNSKSSAERNERVNEHQKKYGSNDQSHQYTVLATDIAHQADRAFNGVKDVVVNPSKSSLKTKYLNSSYNKAMLKVDSAISNLAKGAGKIAKKIFKPRSRSASQGRNL